MRKWVLLGLLMSVAALGMASSEIGEIAQVDPDSRVLPVYPPAAYAARYDCSVVVAAVINDDGSVGEIEVMKATRPKLGFEEATVDALKQWHFAPALKDGKPVTSVAAYQLDYRRMAGGGGGAYVTGHHLMTQFTPNLITQRTTPDPTGTIAPGPAGLKIGSPSKILRNAGFSPEVRLSRGVQTIDIPPEARQCEMCIYSREGIIPGRRPSGRFVRPN